MCIRDSLITVLTTDGYSSHHSSGERRIQFSSQFQLVIHLVPHRWKSAVVMSAMVRQGPCRVRKGAAGPPRLPFLHHARSVFFSGFSRETKLTMDSKRELELQFIIAASDGNTPELTRCLDAGVDIECLATER